MNDIKLEEHHIYLLDHIIKYIMNPISIKDHCNNITRLLLQLINKDSDL